jgi:hypothetical protein
MTGDRIMTQYKVLSIDAWAGDEPNTWDWNNWYTIGYVEVDINAAQPAIVDALIDANILSPKSRDAANAAIMDDDQYNLVFCDPATHEPLYAVEYGSTL